MVKSLKAKFIFLLFLATNLYSSITGYLKVNSFYLDYLQERSFIQLARLRLRIEESSGSFSFKLHSEVDALNGGEKFYSLFTGSLLEELDPFYLYKGDQLKIYHFFDRLSLSYNTEKFVFTIGRERIPWGKAKLFSVLDIFNPYNPFAIEKEEKQGVNSMRAQYYFSGFSWAEGVYVRRNGEDYYGSALFFPLGSVDINLVAASVPEETIFGGAFEGSSGRVVLRGELAVRKNTESFMYDVSIGADYQLSSKIYLIGEYFFTEGSTFYPEGKVFVVIGDYKISELSGLQISYFHTSPGDGNFLFLRLSYSLSQNLDLYIGFLYSSAGSSAWQFPKIAYGGAAFYY
ncbi:MAG: hypothetical protein ACE5WD_06525 [Candidatus Aminicenantia bacterium]